MKAIVQNDYGSPDVLELKDIDMPVVKDDGMLVIVHATAVNAGDVFSMRGSPWIARLVVGFLSQRTTFLGGMWQGVLERSARR